MSKRWPSSPAQVPRWTHPALMGRSMDGGDGGGAEASSRSDSDSEEDDADAGHRRRRRRARSQSSEEEEEEDEEAAAVSAKLEAVAPFGLAASRPLDIMPAARRSSKPRTGEDIAREAKQRRRSQEVGGGGIGSTGGTGGGEANGASGGGLPSWRRSTFPPQQQLGNSGSSPTAAGSVAGSGSHTPASFYSGFILAPASLPHDPAMRMLPAVPLMPLSRHGSATYPTHSFSAGPSAALMAASAAAASAKTSPATMRMATIGGAATVATPVTAGGTDSSSSSSSSAADSPSSTVGSSSSAASSFAPPHHHFRPPMFSPSSASSSSSSSLSSFSSPPPAASASSSSVASPMHAFSASSFSSPQQQQQAFSYGRTNATANANPTTSMGRSAHHSARSSMGQAAAPAMATRLQLEEVPSYEEMAACPPHIQAQQARRASGIASLNNNNSRQQHATMTQPGTSLRCATSKETARLFLLHDRGEGGDGECSPLPFDTTVRDSPDSPEAGFDLEFDM